MYKCERCGNEFEKDWRRDKATKRNMPIPRFCSRKCSNTNPKSLEIRNKIRESIKKNENCKIARERIVFERLNKYLSNPSKCKFCGKSIEYNNRKRQTCSYECYAKLRAMNIKKSKRKVVRSNKVCYYCGNNTVRRDNKFCSSQCFKNYEQNKKIEEIIKMNGIGCDIRQIKKYLIIKRGHRCVICGNTEWEGYPIPLVLDHINGRASDNRLENLRLVCGNCDMQLPTYKSKNKNSDRKRVGKYVLISSKNNAPVAERITHTA